MMQFRLVINDTNDGTIIARELRCLASEVDGERLRDGFGRELQKGHAVMQIEAVEYPTCAEAERQLGATMRWSENSTYFIGHYEGKPVAKVTK